MKKVLSFLCFLFLFAGALAFAQKTTASKSATSSQKTSSSKTYSSYSGDGFIENEPLKVNVWSAKTTPHKMWIVHPQFGINFQSDNNFVMPAVAVHYGLTDKLDLSLQAAIGVMLSSTEGDTVWFGDLPVHLRYMFYNQNDLTLTGKVDIVIPTNTAIDSNFQNGYEFQAQYNLQDANVALYGNLGYNFMFKRNGVKPDNFLNYGLGAEYTIPDHSRWHALLEFSGGTENYPCYVTPAVSYNLDASSLLRAGLAVGTNDAAGTLLFANATFRF